MINVGLIGLGAIGRLHFEAWQKSRVGRVSAISSRDPRKLAGEWGGTEFNLGDQAAEKVDLTGIATYSGAEELLADPDVQIVDLCTPTPLHAPLAIAALRAGKHVFCEKPMALDVAECIAMEEAARTSGRQLMIGHCLRYWPHYVRAHEMLASGEFGRPIYASLFRTGAPPLWSSGGWLLQADESGGVLDMHIHDIDVALWWFGRPRGVSTTGYVQGELPMIMDAMWRYEGGFTAHLHSAWDPNGGAFRHGFKLVLEKATLAYDLAGDAAVLHVIRDVKVESVPMETPAAHQAELDDFASCVAEGRPVTRFTPADSRAAVEFGLEELRQLRASR